MPADRAAADRLEPAGVSTGRVLLCVAACFALLAVTVAVVSGMIALQHVATPQAAARPFPKPELETNIPQRATAYNGHGPAEYRRRPPAARAAEVAPPPDRLSAAMDAVAARGDAAYAPGPGAPPPAPTPRLGEAR